MSKRGKEDKIRGRVVANKFEGGGMPERGKEDKMRGGGGGGGMLQKKTWEV